MTFIYFITFQALILADPNLLSQWYSAGMTVTWQTDLIWGECGRDANHIAKLNKGRYIVGASVLAHIHGVENISLFKEK